uniref:Nucleoprotein n=1 Tax=Lentinula edodes negative-strand RNA virus 2 TaxID=2547431 RepID=A0A7S6Z4A5_9VIRU|nr:nucleocapsid protein [Lentinula edodes negative-strand RNA virus 2]
MAVALRNRFNGLQRTDVSLAVGTILTQTEISAVLEADINIIQERIAGEFIIDVDSINAALELLSYEGFDPRIVYAHLAHIQKAGNIGWPQLKEDLMIMLVIHHVRGNINSNNMKSMKSEAKNLINELFAKYHIVVAKDTSKRLAVTLPRLGASFPYQVAQIAKICNRDFAGFCESAVLPAAMKSTSFPSLVPKSTKISLLMTVAYNAYATDQACALKKLNYLEMKEEDRKRLFLEQQRYTDISYNSPVLDKDHRQAALFNLGLGNSTVYKALLSCTKYSSVDTSLYCSETEYLGEIISYQASADLIAKMVASRVSGPS